MARVQKAERNESGQLVKKPIDKKAFDEAQAARDARDMSEPWADENGKIPEFVNVSGKVQKVCVPWQPNMTITVQPMGVLRGAQWREPYTMPNKAWGRHPYFIERVRNGNGEYHQRYILTEEQAVEQIMKFKVNVDKMRKMSRSDMGGIDIESIRRRTKRVRAMVDNMAIVGDVNNTRINERNLPVLVRERDDRLEVLKVETEVTRSIEEAVEVVRGTRGF